MINGPVVVFQILKQWTQSRLCIFVNKYVLSIVNLKNKNDWASACKNYLSLLLILYTKKMCTCFI